MISFNYMIDHIISFNIDLPSQQSVSSIRLVKEGSIKNLYRFHLHTND